MTTYQPLYSFCSVWKSATPDEEDEEEAGTSLWIEVYVAVMFVPMQATMSEHEQLFLEDQIERGECTLETYFKKFKMLNSVLLEDQETSRATISGILSDLEVPLEIQPDMLDKILDYGCCLGHRADPEQDNEVPTLVVNIEVVHSVKELGEDNCYGFGRMPQNGEQIL